MLPYETVLDKHLEVARSLLFGLILLHTVGAKCFDDGDGGSRMDPLSHAAFFLAWAAYHAIFLRAVRDKKRWLVDTHGPGFEDELDDGTGSVRRGDEPKFLPPLF